MDREASHFAVFGLWKRELKPSVLTLTETMEYHCQPMDSFGKPVEVEVRDSLEKALKILKQRMSKEGILQEVKRRRFHEKPSLKRKRKIIEARKRRRREAKPRER